MRPRAADGDCLRESVSRVSRVARGRAAAAAPARIVLGSVAAPPRRRRGSPAAPTRIARGEVASTAERCIGMGKRSDREGVNGRCATSPRPRRDLARRRGAAARPHPQADRPRAGGAQREVGQGVGERARLHVRVRGGHVAPRDLPHLPRVAHPRPPEGVADRESCWRRRRERVAAPPRGATWIVRGPGFVRARSRRRREVARGRGGAAGGRRRRRARVAAPPRGATWIGRGPDNSSGYGSRRRRVSPRRRVARRGRRVGAQVCRGPRRGRGRRGDLLIGAGRLFKVSES